MRLSFCAFIVCLFFVSYFADAKTMNVVSPYQFGYESSQTDIDRYYVLQETHRYAKEHNCGVSYKGIDTVRIDIPKSPKAIPLGEFTDFCGATFVVSNKSEDIFLFEMRNYGKYINVKSSDIDNGTFSSYPELENGECLLVIEDINPWVEKRTGYGYAHIRKDIIRIKKGRALNSPIMPYNNEQSQPSCRYIEVSGGEKVFKNLTFKRTQESTCKTHLVRFWMQDNVVVSNVSVTTPQYTSLFGDALFTVNECTNVVFKNIIVDGTYSQTDKYGYAFDLNTVWNYTSDNIVAKGNWGVYGSNNLNYASFCNSTINRVDVHCYGRDIYCKGCRFVDRYNQFSGTYGTIMFDRCVFENVTPVLNGESYNAYTPVDIVFKNCQFYLTKTNRYIVQIWGASQKPNTREELREKNLPNVKIKGCRIAETENSDGCALFYIRDFDEQQPLGYIDYVTVKGLRYDNPKARLKMFNVAPILKNQVKISKKYIS